MFHHLISLMLLYSVILTSFWTTLTTDFATYLRSGAMMENSYHLFHTEHRVSSASAATATRADWSSHDSRAALFQTIAPGDCNGDGFITPPDITALFAEINDGDGNTPFPSTVGCDANVDAVIDPSDLVCTARLIYSLTCDAPGTHTTSSSLALTQVTASAGMTVTMPITLQSNGNAIGSSGFSIDFDQSCLTVDSSSAIRTYTDASVFSDVRLDLNDTASEIDIILANGFAVNTAIPNGVIATIDFTVTCTPSPGNPIIAPVIFAADLPPSLGVTTGSAVPVTTVNGAIEIIAPSAAVGDCNGDELINAGDISAVIFEIFDGDGNAAINVGGGTFPGTSGCQTNLDSVIDAADIICTVQLIFGSNCGEPGVYTTPSSLALAQIPADPGATVTMPITFQGNGNPIAGTTFSIDFDQSCLAFDITDADSDGLPDAIQFMTSGAFGGTVTVNFFDTAGEIDIAVADFFPPFATLTDGTLLTIDFIALCQPSPGTSIPAPVIFAGNPSVSMGATTGASVPVAAANGVVQIQGGAPQAPSLTIADNITAQVNSTVTVPIEFQSGGADVAAVTFVIDYDETCLELDPTDSNADDMPDAVTFFTPEDFTVDVLLSPFGTEGEVGILVYDIAPLTQLPDLNPLVAIEFSTICHPGSTSRVVPIPFSSDHPPSFASSIGGAVSGTGIDGAVTILGTAPSVTLPTDATGAPNSQITIPVMVPNSVDGLDIIAFDFRLAFDPSVLSIVSVNSAGTLSGGWTITPNTSTPGEVQVAAFNVTPLSGSGTLLNLVFDVVGTTGSSTPLIWNDFIFNEGQPAVQVTAGLFTVTSSWTLGGQVYYQESESRAMRGVTLDLQGASAGQTVTAGGGYSFTVEATGPYTLTPSYSGPVNGITSFDAAYVAQCVAGLRNMADCPLLAADTSGNSSLSSFDAALIAQYAAGLAGPTSRVGTWVFDPVSRSYAAIESDLLAEDFGAYLVGEVTGNWSAPATGAAQTMDATQRPSPLAVAADSTKVTLHLRQPHSELLAFQATLRYDADAGNFVEAQLTQALGDGWELVTNEVEPGIVVLVGYGTTPITEDGALVTLRFSSHNEAEVQPATLLTTVQLNEEQVWNSEFQAELSHKQFLPLIVK